MMGRPLIVDLDGTLVDTDMLHELAIKLFMEKPWIALRFPIELRKGKAALKRFISSQTDYDASLLPYNKGLLAWLREQKSDGRYLVLCTASDIAMAKPIGDYLGLFDQVMASDGAVNLSGNNKANALVAKFGRQQFDYCGNASIDLIVWQVAHSAIVVNGSARLLREAENRLPVVKVFSSPRHCLRVWRTLFRAYHWWRNLIVLALATVAAIVFPSHSVTAVSLGTAIYFIVGAAPLAKDLYQIETHRTLAKSSSLPRCANNHFASGDVPIAYGVVALLGSLAVACMAVLTLLV